MSMAIGGMFLDADKQKMSFQVEQGFPHLSTYTTSAGDRIWVLTEEGSLATIILLPEEYDLKSRNCIVLYKAVSNNQASNGHRAHWLFFGSEAL